MLDSSHVYSSPRLLLLIGLLDSLIMFSYMEEYFGFVNALGYYPLIGEYSVNPIFGLPDNLSYPNIETKQNNEC